MPASAMLTCRGELLLTTKRLACYATPPTAGSGSSAHRCGSLPGRVRKTRKELVVIQSWQDAPEIHPSQIRVGDTIGTLRETALRYTVKLISTPQQTPRKWTFFGRDDKGADYANVFSESDLVRRYAKAS